MKHPEDKESHVRTFLKTLSWRLIATATTITIAYFVFGDISNAMKVGGIEFLCQDDHLLHTRASLAANPAWQRTELVPQQCLIREPKSQCCDLLHTQSPCRFRLVALVSQPQRRVEDDSPYLGLQPKASHRTFGDRTKLCSVPHCGPRGPPRFCARHVDFPGANELSTPASIKDATPGRTGIRFRNRSADK